MTVYWAERILTGSSAVIFVEGDLITDVQLGVPRPSEAEGLPGLTVPGFVNSHSHAFHRLLRGHTHRQGGDFWTWRDGMYAVAETLDPDSYLDLATAVYAEMALAGITSVAEFHYLHHQDRGRRYADANAMGVALIEAASQAGVRLTLLDTLYLQSGVDGQALQGAQLRFGDGDFDAWAERVAHLDDGPGLLIGAAAHSVRAVGSDSLTLLARWATDLQRPLHAHVSEQLKENEDCLAALGRTPTGVLADADALGPWFTAVHATHLTPSDVGLLGKTGSNVCFCPTTERDLADGIGPASDLVGAGARLALGSDSHAVIDLLEEARAVELDLRLASGQRGSLGPETLAAALWNGAPVGGGGELAIKAGCPADLTSISVSSPRTAGTMTPDPLGGLVFAATGADVTHVVSQGRMIVSDGHHLLVPDAAGIIERMAGEVWS